MAIAFKGAVGIRPSPNLTKAMTFANLVAEV